MKKGAGSRRQDSPTLYFPLYYSPVTGHVSLSKLEGYVERYPIKSDGSDGRWTWGREKIKNENHRLYASPNGTIYIKDYLTDDRRMKIKTVLIDSLYLTDRATNEVKDIFNSKTFDTPKPIKLLVDLLDLVTGKDDIILDFFSGSATTAHAVMQLNAEDGGNRKFIMVQLPEETDEKSEAYKAGYKNICEIGKERIRRAGKKIVEELSNCGKERQIEGMTLLSAGVAPSSRHAEWIDNTTGEIKAESRNAHAPEDYYKYNSEKLDIGFRVLKCDSSNMKEVYYTPDEYEMSLFDSLEDNIKEDRTPEDLLFQVMLDLGILLSSKIQVRSEKVGMRSYSYFDVEDGYLIACFDKDIDEEVITAIAKQKPYYFVMRDSSMANDSVATNFDQIFATYSPSTIRKVL